MNAAGLASELTDLLRFYWRIRAGVAVLLEGNSEQLSTLVEYANVPTSGPLTAYLASEPLHVAFASIRSYESSRLTSDLFLMEIAVFEKFLSARIASQGRVPTGTLGHLQREAETLHSISGSEVDHADEVRERRNCLLHNSGKADQKYVAISTRVAPTSGGSVRVVAVGDSIAPSQAYLTYAAAMLIQYAGKYPV